MGGSSQVVAAKADAAGARPSRWRAFFALQAVFWGGFFAIRAFGSARFYPEFFWSYMGPRVLLVAVSAAGTTVIHLLVHRLTSWTPGRRLALTLALCALLLYPTHVLDNLLVTTSGVRWPQELFLDYVLQYGWVMLAWAGYDFALDWAHEVQRQAGALQQAQALAHAAEIKMLRYQLNPHFLFNSLNAISALVLEKRNDEAEGMLLRLSRFLRHTIDSDPTQLARLGDEALLQRLYLEMEAVRFGDKMQVMCTVPEALHDCLVPSLLLQPIVENAIKHGVAKAAKTAHIAITAQARSDGARLSLSVENDGPPFQENGRGLGLRNTQDRLRAIYGGDASMSVAAGPHGGVRVEFDLPLLRAK
ncbi:MAG TPA: histidine kinase [Caulobacterales bacterium]|nr:histidine kinase [Caulobacterales bacterium]